MTIRPVALSIVITVVLCGCSSREDNEKVHENEVVTHPVRVLGDEGTIATVRDYRLSVLMADLGSWLADNPGYHGKYVTMMLETDFKTACKNNSRTSFPGDYSIDDDPELNE